MSEKLNKLIKSKSNKQYLKYQDLVVRKIFKNVDKYMKYVNKISKLKAMLINNVKHQPQTKARRGDGF